MGFGALSYHQRQRHEALRQIGLEHGAVIRYHRDPAVPLPQRECRTLDDIDLKLARIEFQYRGLGDPWIGLQALAHGRGIEEQ